MIWISFGKWSYAAGLRYTRKRIYWGWRWTPFVKVAKRNYGASSKWPDYGDDYHETTIGPNLRKLGIKEPTGDG